MTELPHHEEARSGPFGRGVAGLPPAGSTASVRLGDGDQLSLRIAAVAQPIGDARVRMLAYNGTIPGPTLRVRQGSEIVVHVTGLWMAHCHISEHIESGMMFHFRVARPAGHEEDDAMAMVTDPVCGMRIDSGDAAARAEHRGVTYYFCSQACHDAFVAAPGSYAG